MTYYHRRLPHWHPPGQSLFLTWRLHGSLPKAIPPPQNDSSPGQSFVHYDRILDKATTGPLWLNDARIAQHIISTMIEAQKRNSLRLHAYTLMPNHVHVLLTPVAPLAQITQQIKGLTARKANLILSRTGSRFWQDETFDHWVRNAGEWQKIRTYIEYNPVAARLVAHPEDWPWSSASNPIPLHPQINDPPS